MDGALIERLSWGRPPPISTSPEAPPPSTSTSPEDSPISIPASREAPPRTVNDSSSKKFTPSGDVVALIVAGLHSIAALVLATSETERHRLEVIATRPKDESQQERLRKLALAVVHHESVYGFRGYAVSRDSATGSHPFEVCKANMVDVYTDRPKISETLSLCFESMTHKIAYFVQVDHNNHEFQNELGGDIGLLAKLMIFPFKVALEVQHRTTFAAETPAASLRTLAIQTLTINGTENVEILISTAGGNQQAIQVVEAIAAELIRESEEQAATTESTEATEPEEMAKLTRNQRRKRGRPSANKKDAGGEDLDKAATRASAETSSASPKPHRTTTIGTTTSPAVSGSSQSVPNTYIEDSLPFGTALSPTRKAPNKDTEFPKGPNRTIPSLAEPSTSSPSVLVSSKMSDKSAITSPRPSRLLVATPLTPPDRRVFSPRTTASPDVQTSESKKLCASPVHTPSPVQSKSESVQLWKALRQSESPSLEPPVSGDSQTPLGSSSLEEEMSAATPHLQPSALGKKSVTSLEAAESDGEWERMPEEWQVVEAKQKRKNAKQNQSAHQRNASKGKPSSEHSEGKRETPWAKKLEMIPHRPPPPPPVPKEPKGRPKRKADNTPLAPKIGEENFPALPAPFTGPQPKLEAKTKTSSAPVRLSAAAQPKVEVKFQVPVVPLVSSAARQRNIEAKAQITIAPAASPRVPSANIVVKEQSPIVPSQEVKDLSSTEVATSSVDHIHKEDALETSSRPREEPSGKLTDIPEETIVEPPLLDKPLDTTVSSQDKGKSKEPIVDNSPILPQISSYLAPESHPGSFDEKRLTENPEGVSQDSEKRKSKKSKSKRKKKQSQIPQKDAEIQGMGDPKSTTAAGFDPHSSLPDSSGPSSSSTHAAASAPAFRCQPPNAGFLPEMSGISYYYVPRGPPMTLPARPNLYLPPLTVPSWLGAPMVFNAAEPGPLPSTFSATTGRAMRGPMMSTVSHLGPTGAATVTAAAAAGVPVGFVPRNLNEPLPSTVPNKPSHFVYRLDSTGWECAKQGCEKRTNDWDGYSTICQQCGPYSPIRYCSTEHVLEDAGAHHYICPVESFRAPAVELPSRFAKLLPLIPNVNQPTHALRTRQSVFNATNDAGGYALFTDSIDFNKKGTPKDVASRARNAVGEVWYKVTFEEAPEHMDRFNRVLHAVFFDEAANGAAVVYLGRMIRQNLRERGLWNEETQNQLQYQFMGEFKFMTLNDTFSQSYRDNCWTEWTGHSARYCPAEICRYELCNPNLAYGDQTYGRGILQHVEAMESYHWILRAWRVFHPTVKKANDRIKGVDFQGVPDEQKGKLRGRGEGWDGYGNVGDERCS